MGILEELRFKNVSRLLVKKYDAGIKRSIRNRLHCGLIFCERGKIVFKMNDNSYVCSENKVILAPKGSDYDLFVEENSYTFIIDFELHLGTINNMHELTIGNRVSEYYYKVFIRMQNYSMGPKTNDLVLLSLLYDVAAHINDQGYLKKQFISIKRSEKYLEDNVFNAKLSIKNIAKASNISEVYFRRLFKEKYDQTPISYINEMRIKRAKNMLISAEELSIKDISELCGYLDIYSFSRSFKKYVGISPSQYRKNMQFRNC